MPGPYSSRGKPARRARARLALWASRFVEIPIGPVFEAYRATLGASRRPGGAVSAEENLQARIRGAILMALSNRFGHLVLSTGNKSEIAVGYCTLYGDMAGGYALISDVPKTLVYELARGAQPASSSGSRGRRSRRSPRRSCAPDQKDSDSLPPYERLDPLVEALVDRALPVAQAARRARVPLSLAAEIADRIDRNEYKRRQMPPGPKVTARAFGEGRRYPIAQKFRG